MGDPFSKNVEDMIFVEINSWDFWAGSITSFGSSFIALNAKNTIIIDTDAIAAPIAKDGPWINR